MRQTILRNWNFMRAFRLIIGIAIIIQAAMAKDVLFGLAGIFFSGLALFNSGCCGSSACYTPVKKDTAIQKEICYEEVV
jgi:hypothetical protein